MTKLSSLILGSIITFSSTLCFATCDLCSIYVAQQQRTFLPNSVVIGVSEQFTSFEKMQLNGNRIDDPAKQYLKGSTTQIFSRYDFTEEIALQANVPFIYRRYRRASGDDIEKGSISGVGDMSIQALYSPLHIEDENSLIRVTLQGGIKMPTGDSDKLRESHAHEVDEHLHHGGSHEEGEEITIPDGVHSHSLALGSGSWDGIFGANLFLQHDRWLASGGAQFFLRTEGTNDYRFDNDLQWDLGVGKYVLVTDQGTVAVRLNLLGEAKGMDREGAEEVVDSGITSMFGGPEINFTAGTKLFASAALDLPIFIDNTGAALASDYRFRLAMVYRF